VRTGEKEDEKTGKCVEDKDQCKLGNAIELTVSAKLTDISIQVKRKIRPTQKARGA
jgi:hypothetical protein